MIEVINLSKSFGNRKVLHGLNFKGEAGEIIALTGKNGAGKSTFLRILACLSHADGGTISFNGAAVSTDSTEFRKKIGVVLHAPMLYLNLTAEENLRFFCRLYAVEKPESRILQALENVALTSRAEDLVRTFSRGMQQRLSIARALLHDPEVLLMDEPYTGLDQDSSQRLDELLQKNAAQGKLILLATHDIEKSLSITSRLDILHQGKIEFSCPSNQCDSDQFIARFQEITSRASKPVNRIAP